MTVPLLKDVRTLARIGKINYESMGVSDIQQKVDFPRAPWMHARKDEKGRYFPNAIAHRGYKVAYPENSMAAFQGAVAVGAQGLETDLRLSKDGVVVLSHDKDLKRCFGVDRKVNDCDWDYLKTLRTTRAPGEPIPRFQDLLEFLALPGNEHVFLLLDIKLDDDADDMMRLIASTISSVPAEARAWNDRIVLAFWTANYLTPSAKYLPDFPVIHTGVIPFYSEQFLDVPNCSFSMSLNSLFGPVGRRFRKKIRENDRRLFVWTVNQDNMMKWCIQHHMDGIITDDPKLFLDICNSWSDDEPPAKLTWRQGILTVVLQLMSLVFLILLGSRRPFNYTVKQYLAGRSSDSSPELKVLADNP